MLILRPHLPQNGSVMDWSIVRSFPTAGMLLSIKYLSFYKPRALMSAVFYQTYKNDVRQMVSISPELVGGGVSKAPRHKMLKLCRRSV